LKGKAESEAVESWGHTMAFLPHRSGRNQAETEAGRSRNDVLFELVSEKGQLPYLFFIVQMGMNRYYPI
jgi:hypothetical protein